MKERLPPSIQEVMPEDIKALERQAAKEETDFIDVEWRTAAKKKIKRVLRYAWQFVPFVPKGPIEFDPLYGSGVKLKKIWKEEK